MTDTSARASVVRLASFDDRAAVAGLRRAWTEEKAGGTIEDDGMPRPGETRSSQWGYLANCYVRPERRSTGLGSRLLDACTAYADEHGFVRIVLSPSERSVPFYGRGGFGPATSLMVRQAD